MNETYRWDFFIAHAAADTDVAERLFSLLNPCRVFLDSKCLLPGDDWDRELIRAQADALITLILVSQHTDRAYYQREETAIAIRKARNSKTKHRVIPLFLDKVNLNGMLPYGLNLKHGLSASNEDELRNTAVKLIHLLPTFEAQLPETSLPIRLDLALAKSFAKMQVESLGAEIVMPLLKVLHPGSLEQLPSDNNESAQFLSFGMDALRRPHVLFVHIEGMKNSSTLRSRIETLKQAKSEGIQSPTGRKHLPDEIWLVLSVLDSSTVGSSLSGQQLNQFGIKVVHGPELGSLLSERLPDVATRIAQFSRPEVVGLISTLDKHNEARAFGLSTDRNITEFYVTAALAPHAFRAAAALKNELRLGTYHTHSQIPIGDLIVAEDALLSPRAFKKALTVRIWNRLNESVPSYNVEGGVVIDDDINDIRASFLTSFSLEEDDIIDASSILRQLNAHSDLVSHYIWEHLPSNTREEIGAYAKDKSAKTEDGAKRIAHRILNDAISFLSVYGPGRFQGVSLDPVIPVLAAKKNPPQMRHLVNRLLLEHAYPESIQKWRGVLGLVVDATVSWKCESVFNAVVTKTRTAVRQCPDVLRDNVPAVKYTFSQLTQLDEFIRAVETIVGPEILPIKAFNDYVSAGAIRVRVPEPERLLNLGKLVLVEGPPGCGKTTLLKMLTLSILNRDGNVIYLPCSRILSQFHTESLESILAKFGLGTASTDQLGNSTLIVDGLDEAAFDLAKIIQAAKASPRNVVVSCRTAFATSLRTTAFRIALVPFEHPERDEFFARWFKEEPELLAQARSLVATYRDIDIQTRLPLIATITVALLQNGITPRSRAEIYGLRLDLLLSKWDRVRSVKRVHIDNPDAKRRFLRFLAHELHATKLRRRLVNEQELRDIYEKSLGRWGYHIGLQKVLEDLVLAAGVIMEEAPGIYSLGHLTFQEYLAGEYIVREYSIEEIADLLGDDWWREPLNFYASLKGDITELLEHVMKGAGYIAHARQLAVMSSCAPYTSAGAIEVLRELAQSAPNEDLED